MTIRQVIAARAHQLKLNGYDIARALRVRNGGEWIVATEHMQTYLDGRKDLRGHQLDAVFAFLGIIIRQPCPRDTDGDGNCGQRFCPYCGTNPYCAERDSA